MYGLGGMWFFSLILVLPLLIGVATTSKRVYEFVIARGVSRNNALTVSVVGLILLAGVMSSPLFLGALPFRVVAGISYLYFLFVGGKSIVAFFTGGSDQASKDDDSGRKPAPRHQGGSGSGNKRGDQGKPEGEADADRTPPRHEPAPVPPPARNGRAEIERRLAEREDNK